MQFGIFILFHKQYIHAIQCKKGYLLRRATWWIYQSVVNHATDILIELIVDRWSTMVLMMVSSWV